MKKGFLSFWLSLLIERLIIAYQRFISPLIPGSCRYYPTCSEYAIWVLKFNHPVSAFCKICLRILKCNQIFKGGIDYPIGSGVLESKYSSPQKIIFWLIPLNKLQSTKKKFYIIKTL